MATRWQEGVCRQWRQAGSSPVEENTAAMPCWAQRRLESQCTVSTSSSSQDPSDIALPGLQPLPITHSVSTRTHTMHSVSQHTHTLLAIPSNYHILYGINRGLDYSKHENGQLWFYISTLKSPINILITKMDAGPSATHISSPQSHR